jgi:glucose/arabinose dehydrogenase
MVRSRLVPAVAMLLGLAACGGDSSPPSSGGSSGGIETVTGRERFGWTQSAEAVGDLTFYRYALYVDNERRVVEGETCAINSTGQAFECSAQLPPLGAGRHTLELAAFMIIDGTLIEGPRSPVLHIAVAAVTAPPAGQSVRGGPFESTDGIPLVADILAGDLLHPVDLGIAPDNRVFVAERGGRVRIFQDGSELTTRRDENLLHALGETVETDAAALLSLTLTADFASSRQLHIAYATVERGQPIVRVVRARELAGILGQTAVLLTYPVPQLDVPAVMRFGPDAMLYLAIGGSGGDDPQGASAAGKLLRLGSDGTTPDDSPAGSPVVSSGHHDPRGLAWQPDNVLWTIERNHNGDRLMHITRTQEFGTAAPRLLPPATVTAVARLEPGSDASGIATVTSTASPFSGDLLVASAGARDLLRFRFDADGRPRLAGGLLPERFGRIGQVATDHDGGIYFVTANAGEWGAGRDVLVRVRLRSPESQKPPD